MHPDPRPADRDDAHDGGAPDLLDVPALRRRVLLAGGVTMVLFLTAAYVLTALRASSAWLLPVVVLLWVVVVRPLMAPVRAATRLRRDLAFRAFLDGRDREDRGGG